ncbi:efflux transporter periplasmic adaptor subunit [Zavarzinia compransoris]|uniref:Efflux transporter periplasmic adaptor subunit n=2 Tax=Zavarzinia compransoris TaxID=1264899 RepID=A0A317E4K0_9PROT|nr:efflux transporter periplasmic adaptor subunit [Zavarzinia compransoris]
MPVTVAKPLLRQIAEWDDFTGRFAPVSSVEVRARVSGYLDSIHFKDGQEVSKGQLLYVIDPRPFEAVVERARADVDAAEAALDLAVREVARYSQLRQSGNASQQVLDERLQARRGAEASVAAAKASLRQAELNLAFTRIEAPIAGRISRTNVTVGNLVSGDAAGSVLTTIVSVDPIQFYFDGDEQVFIRYQRQAQSGERPDPQNAGLPVRIGLSDEIGFPHAGAIDFVDNQLDNATGTIRVRAVLANPDRLLTPGMFGRIRVPASEPKPTLLVPETAIGTDQTRRFVWVVGENNVPRPQIVDLGAVVGSLRVVRGGGLKETDQVIVNGIMRVRPNVPVTPLPAHLAEDGSIVSDVPPPAAAKPEAGK